MREVVIVDGVRSAFTNFGGGLRTLASVDIASRVVDGLLKRTGILERGTVDGLIAGCALGDMRQRLLHGISCSSLNCRWSAQAPL